MLARVARHAATVRVARQARAFCAVADQDSIVKGIEDAIVEAKAAAASTPTLPYSQADLEADAASGSINVMKLGEIFKNDGEMKGVRSDPFSSAPLPLPPPPNPPPPLQPVQLARRRAFSPLPRCQSSPQLLTLSPASAPHPLQKVLEAAKYINAGAKAPANFDWDAWDAKFTAAGLPGVVDSFKKEVNPMLEKLNAQLDERTEEIIAKQVASFDEKLNAPDGLLAKAKKIDEQCAEGKKASILKLEELLYQAQNADKLTVAEMLEKNPDWREAIEEDIKNHNWSPEAPASIIAALDAKMEQETAAAPADDAKKIES